LVLHSRFEERGIFQVDVHPGDKEKTAFSTGQGLWKFTVMPFGLCNALATFERLVETVLRGLTYDSCLVYLDDVIVIGRTFHEHLRNLRIVFQRFREARLNSVLKNANFFRMRYGTSGILYHQKG
jgi:hypothetical protein